MDLKLKKVSLQCLVALHEIPFFHKYYLLAFQCTGRKLTGLTDEYAGGASQCQECQYRQQDKGMDSACGGSGRHGLSGSLRRCHYGGADCRSDSSGQLLHGVDHCVAVTGQFLWQDAESVCHGSSHGKCLTQSEEYIKSGNEGKPAFSEEKCEADCRNDHGGVACKDRLSGTDAV